MKPQKRKEEAPHLKAADRESLGHDAHQDRTVFSRFRIFSNQKKEWLVA